VLPDWRAGTRTFNLIYPSRRLLPQRVRAVIDAIVAQFDGLAPQPAAGAAQDLG
jgi:DNA-binding transcriptional LysR family regulator